VLGKYNQNVVLPKTKNELVKQLNSLGQVDIKVLEPVERKDLGQVRSEIDRFIGTGQNGTSIVMIKKK
jgi:hypothetical protein